MSYLSIEQGTGPSLYQHGNQGMGDYDRVGDWTWEFNGPNAFAFLDPADSMPQPAPLLPSSNWFNPGLSGCGCGGKCGGCGKHDHGMGQITLFQSMDISTWSWPEWAAIGAGLLLVSKLWSGGRSAAKSVSGYRRKRARRAKALAGL